MKFSILKTYLIHKNNILKRKELCKVLVGKPERKSLVRRPRFGLKDNIKTNLRKIRWGDTDWINLIPDT
jgi:hypothetical protein